MARQKEFDQDKALEDAMTLFWRQGYASTSIQDLVDHLGVGRRSLYDTFTSKHDLFIAALDRYRELAHASIASAGGPATSPRGAIQAIFEQIVAEAMGDRDRKGCLIVNSTVECAGLDDAVTVRSKEGFRDLEALFHGLLLQAQQLAEVSADHDLQALAQYLTNTVLGIRVISKMNPDKQILTNIVTVALSVLD